MPAQIPKENRHATARDLLKTFLSQNFLDVNKKPLYTVTSDPSDNDRVIVMRKDMRGQELPLKLSTAHEAPIGWKGHKAGNKAIIIETKYGNKYVQGATGIGRFQSGAPLISLASPIESLGNLINASFERTTESNTGSGVMKQFQHGMQHGIPKKNVVGGMQIYSRNQRNTQALGALSSDVAFMYGTQKYSERMAIQNELRQRMTRPDDPNWSGLEAHVPREPSGNVVRYRIGGEVSRHGSKTRDTLIDAIRSEKQAYNKYLSFGVRNQLTPIVENRQSVPVKNEAGEITKWKTKFSYSPMQAQRQTSGNFSPLKRPHRLPYVKWGATFGGEDMTPEGDLIPQESLTGLIVVAPTLYSGAAMTQQGTFDNIYGAQYNSMKRKALKNVSFQDLLDEDKGIQFTENFKPGNLLRKAANPRGHGTIGFIGDQRIRLPLKQADFAISDDPNALRMLIPATYRDIDNVGPKVGKSTEDILDDIQKRYPGVKVEISKDVDDVTILAEGGQITGFSEKGTIQRTKSGLVQGVLGTFKTGSAQYEPSMVTGEAKSLPWMMGAAFALQPYENQLDILKKVDPELARKTQERYAGNNSPTLEIDRIVKDYEELQKAQGKMKPEMQGTQIGLFSDMLSKFAKADDEQNVANIKKFGIGRTGEQWVSSQATSDTKRFFQHIIKNTLKEMYPDADAKQITKLARTRFRFNKEKGSDLYRFQQKTSGMVFPGVIGMAEEWAGDLLMNYEGMTAVSAKYPEAAKKLGLDVGQGPFMNRKDKATRAWYSVHQALSYNAQNAKGQGTFFSPTSMTMVNQEKAEEFIARLQSMNYDLDAGERVLEGGLDDLPDESQIAAYKEAWAETFEGADPFAPAFFSSLGKTSISPSAIEQLGSFDFGSDVTKLVGKGMRATTQMMKAESLGDPSIINNNKLVKSFDATLNTALSSKNAKSAMKRLFGRRAEFGGSYRYVTADFLESNEEFFPNEELQKLGLNVEAIDRILGEGGIIPVIAGRYPTQDRSGGAIASKLVTEKILRERGVKDIPTVPTPGKRGDASARATAYVSHLFSRIGEGDIDKDMLWTVFGIKEVQGFEEYEKDGKKYLRKKVDYEPVVDDKILKDINAPFKERLAMMENIRSKSFGQYAEKLDVYGELVKTMMKDPLAEALKTMDRPTEAPYSKVVQRAEEINIMNKAGMGKAYNIRRQLEAQMSMIGTGYGNEDIGNMYLSSKYTYQQYLDLLRKKSEGFSPLEEATQTVNINKKGIVSAKVSGKPGSRFWELNAGDRWDISGLLMGQATEATASNEFLSYLLGAGKEGSDYIMGQLKGIDVLKPNPNQPESFTAEGTKFVDMANMVPDTDALNKRNKILTSIMREGKYINSSSPINRMLTERTIEKARTSKLLPQVSQYTLPWKGQATKISDIIQDPDYIRQSTGYRMLKRNKGQEVMSAGDLYELKKMADEKQAAGMPITELEKMAKGIEDIHQFESAKELFDIDYGARQATYIEDAQYGVSNIGTQVTLHASEIGRTAREIRELESQKNPNKVNYAGVQGLTNIVTRSVFGRDVVGFDEEVFGRGEHAEFLLAEGITNNEEWAKVRPELGSWIGGRQSEAGLTFNMGNKVVEGNPDFFKMKYLGEFPGENGPVKRYQPVVTEAKSRNSAYYDATMKMVKGQGNEIESETTKGFVKGQLYDSAIQGKIYTKSIDQTFEDAQRTKALYEQAKGKRISAEERGAPESELTQILNEEKAARNNMQEAEDRLFNMSDQLSGEHLSGEGLSSEQLAEQRKIMRGGQSGNVEIMPATYQQAIFDAGPLDTGDPSKATNISLVSGRDIESAIGGINPEADINLVGGRAGSLNVISQVAASVQNLPITELPTEKGLYAHSKQPFGISSVEDPSYIKGTMSHVPNVMATHIGAVNQARQQIENINTPQAQTGGGGGGGEQPPPNVPFIPLPEGEGPQESSIREFQVMLDQQQLRPQIAGTNYQGQRGGGGGDGGDPNDPRNRQEWKMKVANESYQKAIGQYYKLIEPTAGSPNIIDSLQKQIRTAIGGDAGVPIDLDAVRQAIIRNPSQFQQLVNSKSMQQVLNTAHQADKARGDLFDAGFAADHPMVREIDKMIGLDQSGFEESRTGNINYLRMVSAAATGIGESPVNDKALAKSADAITKTFEKLDLVSASLTGTLSETQKESKLFKDEISGLNQKELKNLKENLSKDLEKKSLQHDVMQGRKELDQIRKQPAESRETGRERDLQQFIAKREDKLQQIAREEEDIGSGKATLEKISGNMRKLVGGWGLFYMKTLATMGMGSWAENYKDVEQYMGDTQQMMGKTMGAGVGIRGDAATALHRARIRGGAGTFEQLQHMKAGLADTALGDISGAGLTGLGFSILGNYSLPALGFSTFATSVAAPAIGGAVGLGALAYNRYATAMSPTAPIQVGSKYLDYLQTRGEGTLGSKLDTLNYAWQAYPTSLINKPAYEQGMQFGALGMALGTGQQQTIEYGGVDYLGQNLYENYMGKSTEPMWKITGKVGSILASTSQSMIQKYLSNSSNASLQGFGKVLEKLTEGKIPDEIVEAPKTWEDLTKTLGGDVGKIALFNQMFAANEEYFAGYSPEIVSTVLAEQQVVGGDVNLDKIRNIAGARQLGIDTSGLAGAMVSQFGTTLPSGQFTKYPTLGAKDNFEEMLSQMNIQETGELTAGLEFLSQLPNAGYFKEKLAKGFDYEKNKKALLAAGMPDLDLEQLQQIGILQEAGKYKGLPQEERIARGLSVDAMLEMSGLKMPEANIGFLAEQTSTSMTAGQIRQFDTRDMIGNMGIGLQTSLAQSTGLSTPQTQKLAQNFIDIASRDLVQGLEYMNRVNLVQQKNPYVISEMFSGVNDDLVSVDINKQGLATGLPLYTTNMSETQAARVWGSDWKTNDKTGIRAASQGIQTPYGEMAGLRGMQWHMQEVQWGFQQKAMDIAGAGVALQREYLPKFWNVEDRQRALGHTQQLWQFGQQEASMVMSQRQQGESWGLQAQGMQMNQDFARQGWAYQDKTRNLQWGWKVEDFQENVRFMTGRERRLAERQMGRETTMHNLEGTQIDKQRQQQEEQWDLQESQFELTKQHFAEQQKFQEEALERQKQFYEEGRQLQEESIALHREYQLKQLEIQEASIGLQREQAETMHELQLEYEQAQRTQDDVVANWQMISLKELGFVETALLGLDTFEEIRKVFQDMWDQVSGGQAWESPLDPEKAIEDIVGEDNMYKALGGVAEPAQIVGEVQQELLISPNGGTIIPVTKLRSPWSDQVVNSSDSMTQSSGDPINVAIYIGNELLGNYVIDRVEREIRI